MTFTTIISVEELDARFDPRNWVIFDCRFSLANAGAGGQAYRFGHIDQARYVHLDNDLSSAITQLSGRHPLPDFSLFAKKLGGWGGSHNSQVVVYDDASGAIAGRMWWLLRCLGHERVALLDGGLPQWQKAGNRLTTTLPRIHAKQFRPYLDNSQWLSARQVENGLAGRRCRLIDARSPERFKGIQEPIDPVAGHIPKAINHPFQNNLDSQGLFLPAGQLRAQYTQLIGDYRPDQVVHMCGSGVTACHNLLAMEIAGLTGSRLYAGSWSEWIRNRNHAVATQAD